MARTKISEFSATPGSNTDIDGIDIAEGCAPSGINNAIRELMAQLKDMQTGASGDTFTLTTVNSTTTDTTNLEVTNLKAQDGTAAGSIASSTGVVTLASSVLTTADINGGTVDGTTIGATTPSTVVATQVDITAQGDLRLQDTTGGQYVALQAPGTIATSYTLTLPVDDGTSGQALITDGSGVLSWSTAASGDVYGPASATDNAVARFDLTTGKIIQNSVVTIDDTGNVAGVGTLGVGAITTSGALTYGGVTLNNAVTGTGNMVLSTSPTLVTPVLGTPSSGTVTNLTGTASININGTVGATTAAAGAFTTLSATGITTVAAGSAALPAIVSTTGTADTGFWFPAADTIAASTAGTERMRIDSAGNVGIGTSSPSGILDARGAVYLGNTSTGTTTFVRGAPNWNFAGLNVIRNAANTSTPRLIAMPLDGDNLASTTIGEYNAIWGAYDSSPTTSSTSSALNGAMVYGAYAGHRWFNNGSERMRIDTSGNLLVGTTSINGRISSVPKSGFAPAATAGTWSSSAGMSSSGDYGGGFSWVDGSGGYCAWVDDGGTDFNIAGGLIGNVVANGVFLNGFAATSWSARSDERLKQNLKPITDALNKTCSLRAVTGAYKNFPDEQQAFLLAQDVQKVLPEAVCVADKRSPEQYLGLAYTQVIPLLVAALQELKAEVDSLKAQLQGAA